MTPAPANGATSGLQLTKKGEAYAIAYLVSGKPMGAPLSCDDLGAVIDALIDALDLASPDPDLEPAGDELDASYPESGARSFGASQSYLEDAEEDDPGEGDGTAQEPTLGAPECHPRVPTQAYRVPLGLYRTRGGRQTNWGAGSRFAYAEEEAVDEDGGDINDARQDGEDCDHQEPSLGWPEGVDQSNLQPSPNCAGVTDGEFDGLEPQDPSALCFDRSGVALGKEMLRSAGIERQRSGVVHLMLAPSSGRRGYFALTSI